MSIMRKWIQIGTAQRSCLHCSLARALRAEASSLSERGLEITVRRSEVLWLPESGARVYRRLREFLRDVRAQAAASSPVTVAILGDNPGKSYVEVTAVFRSGQESRDWEVASCVFPRYVPDTLWYGFAEVSEDSA